MCMKLTHFSGKEVWAFNPNHALENQFGFGIKRAPGGEEGTGWEKNAVRIKYYLNVYKRVISDQIKHKLHSSLGRKGVPAYIAPAF